jgi:hypothetical protein
MDQAYSYRVSGNGGLTIESRAGATMTTRACASGNRTFEITLSGTSTGSDALWIVESIYDKSLNEEIRVPGTDSIVASSEDAAFAGICDRIAKSLRLKT